MFDRSKGALLYAMGSDDAIREAMIPAENIIVSEGEDECLLTDTLAVLDAAEERHRTGGGANGGG